MRYLLPALFSLACLPAQAQQAPTVTFGLKAGASLASLTNRDLQSTSNRRYLWGFHAGLMGNYVLGRGFSLQAEALYSQKGVRDALSAGLAGYEDHLRLHYLDLLALARFRSQGFYFEVGPQLGVLLTARDQVTVPTVTTHEQTVTDSFHRLELGVGSGLPAGQRARYRPAHQCRPAERAEHQPLRHGCAQQYVPAVPNLSVLPQALKIPAHHGAFSC
jgi:hypothetical protein